jgi:hypothetical protein
MSLRLDRAVIALFFVLGIVTLAVPARAQLKLPRVSPKATLTQTVGLTDLTLSYSRPGVKKRTIWGDLVPYDQPWRTGANEATTLTTTDEIQFGGKKLAAGTYSIVTIPGAKEWTVVLNKDTELWSKNEYKESEDVMRVKVTPTTAPHQEWMSLGFEDLGPETASLVLRWEALQVAVPIKVDANGKALAGAREAVASAKADDWRTPYQAASFTFNNDVAMDEGQKWLEKSLGVQENYINLSLKARWQAKKGDKTGAVATAKKAVAAGKASKDKVDTAPTEKLITEWTASN